MPKPLQAKLSPARRRRALLEDAGYFRLPRLRAEIEKRSGQTVGYDMVWKVVRGERLRGEKAKLVMTTVAEIVGQPIEALWPELKSVA